jgi:hypothetical protein
MTQAELESAVTGLRQELAEFSAQDEAHRHKTKRLAYGDLGCAFAFLTFSFVLYLNHNALFIAFLLAAIILTVLAGNLITLAAPRTADHAPSR